MSESSKRESEERALEALIVSQIWQERDPGNIDNLPELSNEERAAMNSLDANLIQRLWDSVSNDLASPLCGPETAAEFVSDELVAGFTGMNRGDEMDEETSKSIEKRRKEILDRLRRKKNGKRQNDA